MSGHRLNATCAALAIMAPSYAHAQTDTSAGAVVSTSVGYQNNPFTQPGKGIGSGFVGASISPVVRLARPRSSLTLSGDAQVQEYFDKNYPRSENYRGSLAFDSRPSERLTVHANVDLVSAIIGSYGALEPSVGLDPTPDVTPAASTAPTGSVLLPPVSDIGLFGTRDRRRSARGSADFALALTERDAITGGGYGEISRYRLFSDLGNNENYGGSLGYNHQISQFLRAGVQGNYALFDYGAARGTTKTYSVQATLFGRLSERWTADGRLGVTFVDGDTFGSTRRNSLSGGLNLCRRDSLNDFCLYASRDVRATGFNGARYVSAAYASWAYRVSERDRLSLSAGYTKEDSGRESAVVIPVRQSQYLRATAGYDRRLSERFSLTASLQYRDIYGSGVSRRADYGGRVGLAYRIGKIR